LRADGQSGHTPRWRRSWDSDHASMLSRHAIAALRRAALEWSHVGKSKIADDLTPVPARDLAAAVAAGAIPTVTLTELRACAGHVADESRRRLRLLLSATVETNLIAGRLSTGWRDRLEPQPQYVRVCPFHSERLAAEGYVAHVTDRHSGTSSAIHRSDADSEPGERTRRGLRWRGELSHLRNFPRLNPRLNGNFSLGPIWTDLEIACLAGC
jgi:hypothetical protein